MLASPGRRSSQDKRSTQRHVVPLVPFSRRGKLDATVADFKLYGGDGKAAVAIDASGRTPAQSVKVSLVNFDAYPFLRDAANFQSIEGKGTITLDLNATGASQSAIVSALGGSAKLEFADGAIRGVTACM